MSELLPHNLGLLIVEELRQRIEAFDNAPGEEFEAILYDVSENVIERFGRDRKWFDHKLSNGDGIEAKTFQCGGEVVQEGSSVHNVLKRARTNRVIPRADYQRGQVLNTYMTAGDAANHLHNFFTNQIASDAAEKGITDCQYMVTLLRDRTLSSIGIWVEELSDFIDWLFNSSVIWSWDYNESQMVETLVGRVNGQPILRWYWEAAFHVNVLYQAPSTATFLEL